MSVRPLRLYLETTVFNYYFDAERDGHDDVVRLFEAIGEGRYKGYASTYVTDELKRAPEPKRSNMLALTDKYGITVLDTKPSVVYLSRLYLDNGVIPSTHILDSTHVALAAVYELDLVVSYNFKHINRDKTRRLTGVINRQQGYEAIVICTAKEVMSNDRAHRGYS